MDRWVAFYFSLFQLPFQPIHNILLEIQKFVHKLLSNLELWAVEMPLEDVRHSTPHNLVFYQYKVLPFAQAQLPF